MTPPSRTAPRRSRAPVALREPRTARNGPRGTYPPLTASEAAKVLCGPRRGPGHVLGIDQATTSGWALFSLCPLQYVASGVAGNASAQAEVLARVARSSGFDWASTLVVVEDHGGIPASSGIPVSALLKLGEARGRWYALLSQAGHPDDARLMVAPHVWRTLLGTRGNVGRDAFKAQAKLWASALTRRRVTSHDEAEAIAIAVWGGLEGLVRWAVQRTRGVSQ